MVRSLGLYVLDPTPRKGTVSGQGGFGCRVCSGLLVEGHDCSALCGSVEGVFRLA